MPDEADPILLVDSDAVTILAISLQFLHPEVWPDRKIVQSFRGVNQDELLQGNFVKRSGQGRASSLCVPLSGYVCGTRVPEPLNRHRCRFYRYTVNRQDGFASERELFPPEK